jgi:hypothetical protein
LSLYQRAFVFMGAKQPRLDEHTISITAPQKPWLDKLESNGCITSR